MTNQERNETGVAPLLQSACAVIGSLMLAGLVAYAMVAAGIDLAGGLPPGYEVFASWQTIK